MLGFGSLSLSSFGFSFIVSVIGSGLIFSLFYLSSTSYSNIFSKIFFSCVLLSFLYFGNSSIDFLSSFGTFSLSSGFLISFFFNFFFFLGLVSSFDISSILFGSSSFLSDGTLSGVAISGIFLSSNFLPF